MIDREDMLELTRRMTPSRNCFTRIAGAYTDREREVEDTFNTRFLKLSSSDQARNLNMAKTIPFAKTNEQLKEYRFKNTATGSMWQLLAGIRDCGLKNDVMMDVLYDQIINNYDGGSAVGTYIFVFHGTYDIPRKGSDGAYIYDGDEVYDFIICAVGGLADKYEPDKPDFGFLYPAFVNRSPDEYRIDIFHEDPTFPENDLIATMLGE